MGAIALKISLGNSCSIGTVSVELWINLSVLWIAGSLVSDRIRCVVAGETFFTNFVGIMGGEFILRSTLLTN